jgi:hypothetical protein
VFLRSVTARFAAAGLTLAAAACECEDTALREIPAPGAERRAVVFERNCGAATGFSTQVSVLGARERVSGAGSVFRADTDHGRAPAAEWGGPAVAVEWVGPDTLRIRHDVRVRVFRADRRRGAVTLLYVRDST